MTTPDETRCPHWSAPTAWPDRQVVAVRCSLPEGHPGPCSAERPYLVGSWPGRLTRGRATWSGHLGAPTITT